MNPPSVGQKGEHILPRTRLTNWTSSPSPWWCRVVASLAPWIPPLAVAHSKSRSWILEKSEKSTSKSYDFSLHCLIFWFFDVSLSPSVSDSNCLTFRESVSGPFGASGLEYANMFAKLGAKVVVIEFMENILQMLDVDLKVIWLTLRYHQTWLNDAKWGKGIPYKRRFKNLGR